MASTTATVWGQVATQLANINGAGVYTTDISGTGRVVQGRYTSPPVTPPCAVVWVDSVETAQHVELGVYRREFNMTIVGLVEATSDDELTLTTAAMDLMDDILRAIEADRSLGGSVYDVIMSATSFAGAAPETGATYGIVVVSLEAYVAMETGA